MRHLTSQLLPIAQREVRLREKQPDWPAEDTAAWRTIAALLEHGSVETGLGWAQLLEPLRTAEQRRIEAVIAARGTDKEAAMEARLGGVVACRRAVERSAWRHGQCLPDLAA